MSDPVDPVSGKTYMIRNVGFADTDPHFLDLCTLPGKNCMSAENPIFSWTKNNPETNNQIWLFTTYPTESGETLFTIQSMQSLRDKKPDGNGGLLHLENQSMKVVQGGAPLAMKLVRDSIVKDAFQFTAVVSSGTNSDHEALVFTDVSPMNCTNIPATLNQVHLLPAVGGHTQLWQFIPQEPV